jgi:hypothetical protein
MSCVPTGVRGLIGAAAALMLLAGSGLGAEPPAKPAPVSVAKPAARSCGGLPRGSRAYRDCIAAEARRDGGGQPTLTPALSTR